MERVIERSLTNVTSTLQNILIHRYNDNKIYVTYNIVGIFPEDDLGKAFITIHYGDANSETDIVLEIEFFFGFNDDGHTSIIRMDNYDGYMILGLGTMNDIDDLNRIVEAYPYDDVIRKYKLIMENMLLKYTLSTISTQLLSNILISKFKK